MTIQQIRKLVLVGASIAVSGAAGLHREIARRFGMTATAVRVRIQRARRKLRARFESRTS